jgi:superfamily II DNA or RNA helicase
MPATIKFFKSRYLTSYGGSPNLCRYCKCAIQANRAISFIPTNKKRYVHSCVDQNCQVKLIAEYNCATELVDFINDKFNTKQPRKVDGEGLATFPYEDIKEIKPIIKGLNARWRPDQKGWQLPLEIGLRCGILQILCSAAFEIDPKFSDVTVMGEVESLRNAHLDWAVNKGLYSFQLEGVRFLLKNKRAILGDDMGLGKTVQSLMALPQNGEDQVLIVVPASLKLNWLEEVKHWRPDYKVFVAMGSKKRKKNTDHIGRFRLPKSGEIIICNYEMLPGWLQKKPEGDKMEQIQHTTLIVDEAHCLKNSKAMRTKKCRNLSWYAKQSWGLTGTPLLNKPSDLWGVLTSFGLQRKVFGDYDSFVALMGGIQSSYGIVWNYGCVDESVPTLIQRAMLRRTKTMALPGLPTKLRNTVLLEMDADLRAEADSVWKAYCEQGLQVQKSVHERREEIVEAARDLRQEIADAQAEDEYYMARGYDEVGQDYGSGFRRDPFEEKERVIARMSRLRKELATQKIEQALTIIEEFEENEKPLVVFTAHKEPCRQIACRPGWRAISGETPVVERHEIVRLFQNGELNGVVGTIKAMGVGLTLLTNIDQTDCDTMLFLDLEWNPSLNSQAEDRICRIHKQGKQRDRCNYITLCYNHEIDLRVKELTEQKQSTIDLAIELASDVILPPLHSVNMEELRVMARESVNPLATQVEVVDLREIDTLLEQHNGEKAKAIAIGKYEGLRANWLQNFRTKELVEQYPEVPAQIKWQITGAIRYLRSVCDGARTEDGMGFNKPDAATMHIFDVGELWESDPVAWHVAWSRIWKYQGQLSQFPTLFDDTAN